MNWTKRFPDSITLVLIIMLLFVGLTWIVPAGKYQRKTLQTGSGSTKEIVVPQSYQRIDAQNRTPQGIMAFLTAPIRGMQSAAEIIAFVFLVGGVFGIIHKTGAIHTGIQSIIRFSSHNPKYKRWIVPFVMVLFSLAGATFGMSEEVLVFILITIPLAIQLGYDSIVGVAIPFVGAGVGFAGAFLNPFTVGIAQGIARVPLFSGWEYRLLVWAVFTVVAIVFVMRYAKKVERDKNKSLVYEIDKKRENKQTEDYKGFTIQQKIILICLLIAISLLIVGVNQWSWGIEEISGLFVGLGIVSVFIGHISAKTAVAAFLSGAKDMMTAAIVIGLTKGILVIAQDGKILDTILYAMDSASGGLPKTISIELMFVFQSILNFFVPSGSGQAALTMPIMSPLSDILHINRQSAVLAFQLGDGLSNMIIPTSGVTMGILAVADIPYPAWLRWIYPLMLIFFALAMLLLIPTVTFYSW